MNDGKLDVKELLAEIRERVHRDIDGSQDRLRPMRAFDADANNQASRRAGELIHSKDLLFLNRNYQFSYRSGEVPLTSKLPGIFGKLIIKLKNKVIRLREFFLRDYLAAEREFHANLVRFLNDVSKYVDARDASCFWELIRKIDYDVTKALDRIERINDEQTASVRSSERRIHDELARSLGELRGAVTEVQGANARNEQSLKELNSVALGLESIVARLKPANSGSAVSGSAVSGSAVSGSAVAVSKNEEEENAEATDYSYLLLENRFRGSEEEIAKRLGIYPPYFKSAKNPVVEIGGGRGELQALFKNESISSYSVDTDRAMVEQTRAKGFDVRLGDGIAHLRDLPDGGAGGVIAVQVVEHLTRRQLEELFSLCAKKVEKGGRIIFETINPQSLLALSSNYFRDLTHVWPLHPDTLAYVMELSGLKVVDVKMLSPVPGEAQLKPVAVQEYMTPRWAYTVQTINHNIEQLNRLLYGYQDYCIIAEPGV